MKHDATEILRHVFSDLSEDDLVELASVAQLCDYLPGTTLCHEGRFEDTFYVIVSGRAEVTKQFDEDTSRVLHQPGPGEFFGEIALVQEGPRSATVRTIEPTVVLEIGRDAFMSVLKRSASMAIRIMLQVTSRLRDNDLRAVADLRQKNVELAQAYKDLETQQRLRSEFLTTVAHELRTPLTAATGYLHLIRSGNVRLDQAPEFLERVAQNLETVVHLVNGILFLQELELIAPKFKPVRVEEVVLRAVRAMVEQATQAGLTLDTRIESGLPQVMGDVGGLSHAVSALLDNAIKFSPDGGEISIRVLASDGALRVEIRDPGIGFQMERLDDLFKPFTRIESSNGHLFGGVGLGLPITRQVVESHGGQIEVESVEGEGSTFTIVLPAMSGPRG